MAFWSGDYGADAKAKALADGARLDSMRYAAKGDFYDNTKSDAYKSDLDKRMADVAARSAPTTGKTTFGADAFGTAARVAPASTVSGATIARPDAAARVGQAQSLDAYFASMNGGGPSVAPAQQQQSTDAALAAFARARAAKGARVNPALAGLAGGREMGGVLHEGALMASATHAKEANDAASRFGALSSAVRGQDLDIATAQAKNNQEAALFSANAWNANALANKGMADQMGQFNASAAVKQAKMGQDVEFANMAAALQSRGMNDQQIAAYLAAYQKQQGLDKDARMAYAEHAKAANEHERKLTTEKNRVDMENDQKKFNAVAQMMMLGASDERAKKDVKSGHSPLHSWLDELEPYEYAYKDPSIAGAAPGRHVSVMAQDLERTGIGKSAVVEGDDGVKRVDYGRLAGVQLAAIVDLHGRMTKLEKRKGK